MDRGFLLGGGAALIIVVSVFWSFTQQTRLYSDEVLLKGLATDLDNM